MHGRFFVSVLFLLMTRVAIAGECVSTAVVTDATGRPMFGARMDVHRTTCVYPEIGANGPCTGVTDDDGRVQFRIIVEGDVPSTMSVTIIADPNILNRFVPTEISCGGEVVVALSDVYRSGRGVVVVRSPLHAEGCGNVLLVHGMHVSLDDRCGYNGGVRTWCGVSAMFADAGYGVAEFLYPTDGRVQMSATRLASALARVERMTGNTEWFVLAHSFGGLVVRECATADVSCAARMRAFVTLGTPHQGLSEWCATFACKPRQQLQFESVYMRSLRNQPLLDIPVTTVAGSAYGAFRCTNDSVLSDGVVNAWSAIPTSFALWYSRYVVLLDHSALACVRTPTHEAFRIAMDVFAASSGCALACTPKELACGKGDACCWDGYDNDCDGKRDFSDIECFDVDPEEL